MPAQIKQFGRFQLIRRLATGGMGELFLASYQDAQGAKHNVVVKRILPHLSSDPDFLYYFRNEGRIASLLNHPNIIRTVELGQTHNHLYIAMEYVPGTPLVQILATALAQHRSLSIQLILHLAIQITEALRYIHAACNAEGTPLNIIHMDLSPHNILVTPDADVKLLDFGIARAEGFLGNSPNRQEFRGRTAYLAPEQIDGFPLDHRVDIFALGIILHEMVVGRPLFRSLGEHETTSRILYSSIPKPIAFRPDCPKDLDSLILNALRRDRMERIQSTQQILQDLMQCQSKLSPPKSSAEFVEELQQLIPPPMQ